MPVDGRSGLRYLSASDVAAAMPPLDERLRLAELTMVALVADAELPPKVAVHPRAEGSFGHAMPAALRGASATGTDDLLGMKWIAGFPGNGALGLPALHGVVLLVDPQTGVPVAILDAGPITAERTAAISGVAIARFAPEVAGRTPRAALIGAGVQARSHLPVIGRTLPGTSLAIFDRHADRALALAEAARATDGIGGATTAETARDAIRDADVVVTVASFGPVRQVMTQDWLSPDALVVPVDYATYCAAEVAAGAALFLVDHREQFLANRDAGNFDDYPDPMATIGEAIVAGTGRPATGRVVVSHLGVGLADLVFGAAILERAIARGLGVLLGT
jgi:ornithine cyclodeaminase/alanine dehydrogenase-like protein (mu-crystallin family)